MSAEKKAGETGKDAWVIEINDWHKLVHTSEVYEDVKSGLLAGEKYIVKDDTGRQIGIISLNSSQELEIVS